MTEPKVKNRGGRNPKPPMRAASSPKNSWTSPKEIARRDKIREALEYRRMCHSYPKIAEAMGIGVTTAYDYVMEGMKEQIREPADEVLHMELSRIDEMMSGIYQNAVDGDINAIATVVKLQERRAKYLGIEKPTKTAFTDPQGHAIPVMPGAAAPIVQLVFHEQGADAPPPADPEKKPEPVV